MPESGQGQHREYIGDTRPSRLQWTIFALCFIIMFLDGLDTVLIGFIAPFIGAEWHLAKAAMTPVFTAGVIGLIVAGCVAGILADRIGRRPLLLISTAIFGLANLASVFAHSLEALIALRMLTGLGLGAAMPCAVTLVAEYAPPRRRALIITSMYCGYSIGGASAGWITQLVAPQFGWRSVFAVGAVLPLLLLPFLWRYLTESIAFLAERRRDAVQVNALLSRIAGRPVSVQLPLQPADPAKANKLAPGPFRLLLSSAFRRQTTLLWMANGCGLMVTFTLINWLPSFIIFKQFPGQVASTTVACFQLAGVVGALLAGWLIDRFGSRRTVAIVYVCVAALATLWGLAMNTSVPALVALAALTGVVVLGGQTGFHVLAASIYPVSARATGLSWMQSVGRLGGILGIQLAGLGIARQVDPVTILAALAIPALVASLCALMLGTRPTALLDNAAAQPTRS